MASSAPKLSPPSKLLYESYKTSLEEAKHLHNVEGLLDEDDFKERKAEAAKRYDDGKRKRQEEKMLFAAATTGDTAYHLCLNDAILTIAFC